MPKLKEEKDELYDEAVTIVVSEKKASTSLIQRKLRIGYARAFFILDQLEEAKIVGPPNGAKPREVLVNDMPKKKSKKRPY